MIVRALPVILLITCFVAHAAAQVRVVPCFPDATAYKLACAKHMLKLADASVEVKVYEKRGPKGTAAADRTLVVVHNNEQKGLDAAKQVVAENYGRLVEIVSNYQTGFKLSPGEVTQNNFRRYLYFGEGKYCVDPNRIYTRIGILGKLSLCDTVPADQIDDIYSFGQQLLSIVTKNRIQRLVIGVHNNTTPGGLSVESWYNNPSEAVTAVGIFKSSNQFVPARITDDEFVLVTTIPLYNQFLNWSITAKMPVNIALQKDRRDLMGLPNYDDGSMSIYFATMPRPIPYLNVEAGGKDNAVDTDPAKRWQKQVLRFALTKIQP
jgi:hypothetical protein